MLKAGVLIFVLTLNVIVKAQDLKCTPEKVFKPFFPEDNTQGPGTGETAANGENRKHGIMGRESRVDGEEPTTEVKDYYYICLGESGEAVKKDCPPNLQFDKNVLGCAYEPSTPEDEDEECEKDGQQIPLESDCTQCYKCEKAGDPIPDSDEEDCLDANDKPAGFNKFLNDFVEGWVCAKNDADRPDCAKDSKIYKNANMADPKSCETFYRCDGTIRVKESCPSGYLFDTVSRVCRFEKEANCPLLSTSPGGAAVKNICKEKAGAFVADPKYCKGYYYCIDEKTPYWGFCVDDKYFNNGFCVSTPRPDTCTCEDVEFDDDVDTVYFPHPDKSKFYVCEKGKVGVPKSCPPGYVFDLEEESCVK